MTKGPPTKLSLCLLLLAAVCLVAEASVPCQLSPAQRKELAARLLTKFGSSLPPNASAQLLSSLQATASAIDPDLVKDRLLHSWATNNVTCTRVKTCMSLDSDVCAYVCKDGSIQPDAWTSYALTTQRKLQYDVPLNYVSLPGSHNSAITLANGYGLAEGPLNDLMHLVNADWDVFIANQQLGLWDQFKLGIRHFELDIHWWADKMRICHAGGIHLQMLNEFIHYLASEFGIDIDWDSETIGCFSPFDRTLNDTFAEIKQFLFTPENKNEFVIFYFDDEEDLETWRKVDLVLQGIAYHFGNSVFTPMDKQRLFPNAWPSMRQLNAAGKNLMFVSRTDYGGAMSNVLFARANLWSEYGPFPFQPYPTCTLKDGSPIGHGKISRVLGDSLSYGPFYAGYDGQMMLPEDLLQEARCNVNFACVDQASPILVEGFVWSWDKQQPKAIAGGCTVAQPNGRWATLDCSTRLPAACLNPKNGTFAISSSPTAWASASCPTGYTFSRPSNGHENAQLHAALRSSLWASSSVWLNHTAST
jgi:hypothetical protein